MQFYTWQNCLHRHVCDKYDWRLLELAGDNPWGVGRQLQRLSSDCIGNPVQLYFFVVEIFHSAIYWCFNCQWSKFLFQPLNTGLIHRAIAQSGGNLGPGTLTKQPHLSGIIHKLPVSLQVLETTLRARSVPSSLERLWQTCLAARWNF